MPIRDSYNNKAAARKLAEKIANKKAAAEAAENAISAANGHHHEGHEAAGTESVDKDLPDDVFESGAIDAIDAELGVDDDDEDNADEEEDTSVSLDEVESVRRDILDPTKQQKLRKGFRMASICWDD